MNFIFNSGSVDALNVTGRRLTPCLYANCQLQINWLTGHQSCKWCGIGVADRYASPRAVALGGEEQPDHRREGYCPACNEPVSPVTCEDSRTCAHPDYGTVYEYVLSAWCPRCRMRRRWHDGSH